MTNDQTQPRRMTIVLFRHLIIRHSNLIRHLNFVIRISIVSLLATAFLIGGCSSPNKANIELRKKVQQLQAENDQLRTEHAGDQREIAGLRDRSGTVPTLSTTRLSELYTTHGMSFGSLTGGADLDPAKPGDEGVVVYITPLDQTGAKLKAAGTFDVSLFDLAEPKDPLIGHCHFNLEQTKNAWNGWFLDTWYILNCPWQKTPRHPNITVKVTFFDELTQTPFTAQRIVHVNLPPAPATKS
jgi:outer membrane murein-binding lipoprotein Lpp